MATPPHPYTFTQQHLAQLESLARKATTDEEGRTLAEKLPSPTTHIESATYDPALRRIAVVLHGGYLAFPLPIGDAPSKAPSAHVKPPS